jgi:uncharacterized protein (TIGR02265 family)
MFLNFLIDFESEHGAARKTRKRCIPFKSYPVGEYNALVDEVAQNVLPHLTVAEARRLLGSEVYPRFTETMVGTALLAVAGHDWNRVILIAPKAYEVSLEPGSVEVTLHRPGNALVRLRDVWTYVDTLHLGIFQGAMKRCGAHGTIEVEPISRCDADFLIQWKT